MDPSIPVILEKEGASGTSPSNCPSENCSHQKRSDEIILMQQDAHDDLKVFSQARGAPLSTLPGYAYDSRAGAGITVYVVDTGLHQDHPVRVTDYQSQ